MSALQRGLLVAALHVALVAGVGAKLMIDRANYPRVWARTAPVDPDLPIRGRYVQLRIEADADAAVPFPGRQDVVQPDGTIGTPPPVPVPVSLVVRGDRLIAIPSSATQGTRALPSTRGDRVVLLAEPLAFFIPEHAVDPSRRAPDEELWVEVTIPRRGPPRPIRLGVRKNGVLTPLDF